MQGITAKLEKKLKKIFSRFLKKTYKTQRAYTSQLIIYSGVEQSGSSSGSYPESHRFKSCLRHHSRVSHAYACAEGVMTFCTFCKRLGGGAALFYGRTARRHTVPSWCVPFFQSDAVARWHLFPMVDGLPSAVSGVRFPRLRGSTPPSVVLKPPHFLSETEHKRFRPPAGIEARGSHQSARRGLGLNDLTSCTVGRCLIT